MKIYKEYELTNHNSYKIHSICSRAFFPENTDDLVKIYSDYSNKSSKNVLGGGYNVILSKEYYEGDFIIIGDSFAKIELINNNLIKVQAGASTKKLCEFAVNNELTGVEVFYDIPSSIGGAVVMNAGASGEEIKDNLTKVKYLDLKDLQVKEIENDEIKFEYRNSFFQKNKDLIVLEASFKLQKGNKKEILDKMDSIKQARWNKQPREYPNAGSVFKRPKNHYVGALIEELELKGFSIGGAKISEKHAGFIINFNNAKGNDIISIINEVKRRVFEKYSINLEVEQKII